jgi:hypothetical protein
MRCCEGWQSTVKLLGKGLIQAQLSEKLSLRMEGVFLPCEAQYTCPLKTYLIPDPISGFKHSESRSMQHEDAFHQFMPCQKSSNIGST